MSLGPPRTPEQIAAFEAMPMGVKIDEVLRRVKDCRDKAVCNCADLIRQLAKMAGVETTE